MRSGRAGRKRGGRGRWWGCLVRVSICARVWRIRDLKSEGMVKTKDSEREGSERERRTSGKMAIILFDRDFESSSRVCSLAFGGGSNIGALTDRNKAVRNEVVELDWSTQSNSQTKHRTYITTSLEHWGYLAAR